jgi:hypothetical protein
MSTRVAKGKWKELYRLVFCLATVFFFVCFLMVYSWFSSYRKKKFFSIKELGSDTSHANVIALHYNFGDGLVGAVAQGFFFIFGNSVW